jgi:hypothetical protein
MKRKSKAKTAITVTRVPSYLERSMEEDRLAVYRAVWPTGTPPLYSPALPSEPGDFKNAVKAERAHPAYIYANGTAYRCEHVVSSYGVDPPR